MKKYIKTMISRLLCVFLALNAATVAPLCGMWVNRISRVHAVVRNVKRQMPRISQQGAHTAPEMAQYRQLMPEIKVTTAIVPVKQTIPNNNTDSSKASYSSSHPWLAYLLGLVGFGWGMSTVSKEKEEQEEEKEILKLIENYNFRASDKLISYLKKNNFEMPESFFALIINSNYDAGLFVLREIIHAYPQTVKTFASLAKVNFKNLLSIRAGELFLCDLLAMKPDTASEFTSLVKMQFKEVIDTECDNFLCTLLEVEPNAAKELKPLVKAQFKEILNANCDIFLCKLLEIDHKTTKELIPLVKAQLKEALDTGHGESLCCELARIDPQSVKEFAPLAKAQFKEALDTRHGEKILCTLAEKDPEIAKEFTTLLLQGEKFNYELFDRSLENIGCDKDIEKMIKKMYQTNNKSFDAIVTLMCYMKHCTNRSLSHLANDQVSSYNHIKTYSRSFVESHLYNKLNQNITHMLTSAVKKEEELNENGYETFYHGQRWKYGIVENWFTKLYSLKFDKKCDDFTFTHVKEPITTYIASAQEKRKREQLIDKGNQQKNEAANFNRLFFMNLFIGGNITFLDCNSLNYMLKNGNSGNVSISMKDTFGYLSLEKYYDKYNAELQLLEKEYNQLSEYGQMLLIGIPKNKIEKCVYLTGHDGSKESMYIPKIGHTTTDIKIILKHLRENPEDRTEFALVNTWDKDGGLNPDSGIKIFPFNAVEPEKMTAYKKKEEALWNKIEANIIADQQIEQVQQS